MSSALKNSLVAAAVVLTIPLLTVAVFWLRAGKVVSVRNDSDTSVEITEIINDGTYVERTETKVLGSGDDTWFYFFPRINGPLTLRCVGGGSFATISLGTEPRRLVYSKVVLDSCKGMVRLWGVAL